MLGGDIMNQLLNNYGLADTGAAEQSYFTALGIWLKQIDNLNSGFKNIDLGYPAR